MRNYLSEVEEIIAAVDWVALDNGAASFALASVYSTLNHAHPFREGNGRTGTLFLHRLAADTRYQLDLSRVSRTEWVSASRDSAPFRPTGTPSPRPFIDLFNRALTR
ncbi:Fic family protein [Rhodococcus sp. 1.20]